MTNFVPEFDNTVFVVNVRTGTEVYPVNPRGYCLLMTSTRVLCDILKDLQPKIWLGEPWPSNPVFQFSKLVPWIEFGSNGYKTNAASLAMWWVTPGVPDPEKAARAEIASLGV
jgi:hypothetical protein